MGDAVTIAVVNAGSGAIPSAGKGWTNTYQNAERNACGWHETIVHQGIRDVTLETPGTDLGDGRWRFTFRYGVTGVGDAYGRDRLFAPRIYWHGSSCATPEVEDWAAPGFEVVQTFRPA